MSKEYNLYWISEDGQDRFYMGVFSTANAALDAIPLAKADLLDQCEGPEQEAAIDAGRWSVDEQPR